MIHGLQLSAAVAAIAAMSSLAVAQAEDPDPAAGDDDSGEAAPADTAVEAAPALSLRVLGTRLDAIRARSEQIRARVVLLKDAVLRGGTSAAATIVHRNRMGDQFRITQLSYSIDGTRVFSQLDQTGELHDRKTIDILSGPIAPGNHTVSVSIVYRGHGYGPFKYLNKETFTVKGSQTFKAVEGKAVTVEVIGYEKKDVPLDQRPAVSFKVSQ